MVAESTSDYGVRVVPYSFVKTRIKCAEYFEFPEYDLKVGMRERIKDIGKAYDFTAIVGFVFKLLAKKLFNKLVKNTHYSKEDVFCIELLVNIFKATRIPEFLSVDPHDRHPGEFRKMLMMSKSAEPVPPPTTQS